MKLLFLVLLILPLNQVLANYDPSNYNDHDYDDSIYDDRWDYDDRDYSDSDFVDDSSNEQQDPNKVWIDSRELIIQKKDCFIKWNISDIWEKIYHIPWCDYYKETLISKEGEMYFCSEYEAFKAWFRKAMNCPNVQWISTSIETIKDSSIDRTEKPVRFTGAEIEILWVLIFILLSFSETLRNFIGHSIIFTVQLPLKISAIILAQFTYLLKINKYSKQWHDTKIRYIKTWISGIEKSWTGWYYRTLKNYYLCKLLKSKLK